MIKNFLFHRVGPDNDLLWPPMRTERFEKCISYIRKRYQVVRIEDLPGLARHSGREKIATISFDDGYKDNMEHAFPILEKYKVKASFYVVTDCIDTNTPTWTHQLDYFFQHTQRSLLNLEQEFLPAKLRVKELATQAARIAYVKRLKPFLKTLTHEQRELVLAHVARHLDDVTIPPLMMNWDEIRVLHKAGHAIGSHTARHSMLGTMQDQALVMKELEQSAQRISQETGTFPVTISYPLGSYTEATIECSKQAGYKMGLAVKQDVYNPENDGIFEIPRIELYNEPWWKTKLRIDHTLEIFKEIIHYK